MAKITSFSALVADPVWLSRILGRSVRDVNSLQRALDGQRTAGSPDTKSRRAHSLVKKLMREGRMLENPKKAIFIYEQESSLGKHHGIWALTDVSASEQILAHEQTLSVKAQEIALYRDASGTEGAPVLLFHQHAPGIRRLIDKALSTIKPITYQVNDCSHRLYPVEDDKDIREFVSELDGIEKLYIGDGHHRVSAARMNSNKSEPWVMAVLMEARQLRVSGFTRMVTTDHVFDCTEFMSALKKQFLVSPVPSNCKYVPDRLHRFGMYLNGQWYKLDLEPILRPLRKLPDFLLLQKLVLEPLLGIEDPKDCEWLQSDPLDMLGNTLEKAEAELGSIVFTICPINIQKLIHCSNSGIMLPPKSTFIKPKIPYGLLLNLDLQGRKKSS